MDKNQEVGRVWDEQVRAQSSIGVLPPEEQVSDPDEDIDPLAEEDAETEDTDSLAVVEPEEEEEDPGRAVAVVPEAEETEEETEGAEGKDDSDPVISVYAKMKTHAVKDGASGITWSMSFAVDAAVAGEFIELMGEHTYGLVLGKMLICSDGVRIKSVPTRENDADGVTTTVELHISESQLGHSRKTVAMVGKAQLLQLLPVQMQMFGARVDD